MRKLTGLHIIFLLLSAPLMAQVPDSVRIDTTSVESMQTDTLSTPLDSMEVDEEETLKAVVPWQESPDEMEYKVAGDSLLRWQLWPSWGDFQAYRREVISYRMGSIGRMDAYNINGYGPYDQQLTMEGISLKNPITGLPNYNLVPHRKIGFVSDQMHASYRSNIRLRDYYIVEPISYLNYDESSGAYRNLEFLVAQNFTERTNVELSYWDRRGGGYYPNSEVEGSQVVGRLYHHLNDRFLLRAMYLSNKLTNEESLGYRVQDPALFSFDEFLSTPNSSLANSEFSRWDLVTGIYHRADTALAEDGGFELLTSKNKNELFLPADTISWDVRTLGARLFKKFTFQDLNVKADLSANYHMDGKNLLGTQDSWSEQKGIFQLHYKPLNAIQLYAKGSMELRSDEKTGFELTGGLNGELGKNSNYDVSYSVYDRIPTMQALYWSSGSYSGNSTLENESGSVINGHLNTRIGKFITLGASANLRNSTAQTFLTPDSSFTNSDDIQQLSGTVYARFENHLFEIESSGTLQQFDYEDEQSATADLNNQDQIIWLRNSAFVKGYVFDRAAFLKIGIKTLLSPMYYQSRGFNSNLGFWQGNSSYQDLPPFLRVDGELSARVRRIMIVLRMENALDGIGQAGYFETSGYPMPPRRLMVGIRAQFRN